MYYSPHKTPEIIYWKTGLAKSVKNGIQDGWQRPFWIFVPHGVSPHFCELHLCYFLLNPKGRGIRCETKLCSPWSRKSSRLPNYYWRHLMLIFSDLELRRSPCQSNILSGFTSDLSISNRRRNMLIKRCMVSLTGRCYLCVIWHR